LINVVPKAHPPSADDRAVTARLEVTVKDHLIVGEHVRSMKDMGLL
jgi:hypothetical protein